jgi:hypothetical protein
VEARGAAAQDENAPGRSARELICEEAHMDGRRFDDLATTLTERRSRRGFSRLLAGGALGAVAAAVARDPGDARTKSHRRSDSDHGAADTATKQTSAKAGTDAPTASADASAKRKGKRRCRYSQTICSHNGQCCPSTSGYVCAWNGNNEGAAVCCGVNGARCLGDYDCCNQALCRFGVCVG